MAEHTSKQLPICGVELGAGSPFHPRLGDLALDLAKGGQIGVVVDLPSDSAKSYHLRLPGGGGDWRARADGTTLRPVAVPVRHVTPQRRDVVYDARAQQSALPVTIHHEDGGTSEAVLILTPSEVELLHLQLAQLIERREKARQREPGAGPS
ncbi:hypothetical protein ACQUSR_22635 [Streptomyces sp. P1-3]|uniref:hypothetical protein n=1 Tax=Streptomyces sp. P1-3 TaxID=3421658 RepID=UPI003D36978A